MTPAGFLVSVESAEQAARKLTPAQLRAVMAGRIGNGIDRGRGYWPLKNTLLDKKLFTVANGRDVLTQWGATVREFLLNEDRERAR